MSSFVLTAGFLLLGTLVFQVYATRAVTSVSIRPGQVTRIAGRTVSLLKLQRRFPIFLFCVLTLCFPDLIAKSGFGAAFCAGIAIHLGLNILTRTYIMPGKPRPLFAPDTLLYLAPALCYAASAGAWLVS
jgi:hypothetical protein